MGRDGCASAAVAGIVDGDIVMMRGFGTGSQPVELIEILIDSGAPDSAVVKHDA